MALELFERSLSPYARKLELAREGLANRTIRFAQAFEQASDRVAR